MSRETSAVLMLALALCAALAARASAEEKAEPASAACPCLDPERWSDRDAGVIWRGFAAGAFEPLDTTCSGNVKLLEQPDDGTVQGAAVDGSAPECQVFSFSADAPLLVLAIERSEVEACRRPLRDAAANAEPPVACAPVPRR